MASRLLGGDFVGDEMVWWQDDPKPYVDMGCTTRV